MSIRKKTFTAVIWNSFGGVFDMVLVFIFSIVLSRIFGPIEFGLLAIAMSYIGLSDALVVLGFHTALIQAKDVTQRDYSTIFIINVLMGLFFTLLFFVLAPWISDWYGKPELSWVIRILSLLFIINGLTVVHRAYCERTLNFKWLNIARISALIIGGVTGIGMAYWGYGMISLVIYTLLNTLVASLIIWFKSGWKVSFDFSFSILSKYWSYSSRVFGANMMRTLTTKLDVLILGKYQTTATLGNYYRGKSLTQIATQVPSRFMLKPLFASLSKIQDNIPNLREKSGEIIRMTAFIFLPAFIFMITFSSDIIHILYGMKWKDAAPYLCWFGIMGIFQILLIPNTYILLARGKAGLVFNLELGLNISKLILILIFAPISIMSLIYAIIAHKIIEYLLYLYQASKELKEKIHHQIRIAGYYALISIVLVSALKYFTKNISILEYRFIMNIVIFTLVYLITNIAMHSKGWKALRSYLKEF